jgi:hypothetical protein
MHRRDFIKLSGAVAASMAVLPTVATSVASHEADPAVGRLVFGMNQKWRFSPQRIENAVERNFDDSGLEQVSLPHVRGMTAGKTFLTYRRKFRLPPNARGHHVLADLRGSVPGCLTAWINGHCVMIETKYFSALSDASSTCDLTPHVDWAGENELVVEVGPGPFEKLTDYNYVFNFQYVQLRLMPAAYAEIFGVRSHLGPDEHGVLRVYQYFMCPDLWQAHLTTEADLLDGDRVVATGQKLLAQQDKVHGLMHLGLEQTDFSAGNLAGFQPYGRRYSVISRLKHDDKVIDEDWWPVGLAKRPGQGPIQYLWRHAYEIT